MELIKLREEVRLAHSLQEAEKVQDSPSTLQSRSTKLEGSLRDAWEQYMVTVDSIKEKDL